MTADLLRDMPQIADLLRTIALLLAICALLGLEFEKLLTRASRPVQCLAVCSIVVAIFAASLWAAAVLS